MATESLLPPYTLEEWSREMVMRTRAFHWRQQRLYERQQRLQSWRAPESAGHLPAPVMTRLLAASAVPDA